MGIGTSSYAILKLRDDPLVSLLIALYGYGTARILMTGVFPSMRMAGAVWLVFIAALVSTIVVAAYRRKAALLWVVFLEGSGLAGVIVGFGLGAYMALQRPSWLTTSAALLCCGYTAVGILMLTAALRIKEASDGGVPPNKSLERTREG